MRKNAKIAIGAMIVIVLIYILIAFSGLGWAFYDEKSSKVLQKRKLTKSIEEAKRRGVFIKDLNYKADSNIAGFVLHPYIEKAFRYGKDSTETLPFTSTGYPYRLGFQKQIGSVVIFISDNELKKFDSSSGSGNYGASGYLKEAFLNDTVTLGIKKSGKILGTIKVWN
jgi:hypothetical protein